MQVDLSLAERLRECVKLAGSAAKLARIAGIPRSTLETYLTGANAPKPDRLRTICQVLGVNGHWLLLGEGNIKVSSSRNSEVIVTDGQFLDAVTVLKRAAQKIEATALTDDEKILLGGYRDASPERRAIALDVLRRASAAV